jgi:hypothetical protein
MKALSTSRQLILLFAILMLSGWIGFAQQSPAGQAEGKI